MHIQYNKTTVVNNQPRITATTPHFSGSTFRTPEFKIKGEIVDNSGNTYTQNGLPHAIWMTGATELWKQGIDGTGVVIGVIDNGVDVNHPALKLTADGRKKVIREVNISGNPNPPRDHGTLVAGLIAGFELNGYKGCAYNSQIISFMVVDSDGTATDVNLAKAIDLAVFQGCHIINISMGGSDPISSGMKASIDRAIEKGVIIICSSGNDGPNSINYPAQYEKCVSVSGITYNPTTGNIGVSDFASTNSGVDFTAVASDVTVCTPGSGYSLADGTSFSAPIVSGLAALLRHKYIRSTLSSSNRRIAVNVQRMWLLANTIDLFDIGNDKYSGAGLVCFFDKPPMLKSYGNTPQ
jgi:subtilisin family serine protease